MDRGAHCHTSIHWSFLRSVDEEEGQCRDGSEGGDCTNVFDLEFAKIFGVVFVEDDEEDVDGHGECPEDVCKRKPVWQVVNICVSSES